MVMTNWKSAAERLLGEMLPNTNGRSAAERKAIKTNNSYACLDSDFTRRV